MPNQFTAAQAEKARYWYEWIPYTFYEASLPTGTSNISTVTNLENFTSDKLAIVNAFAANQTSEVLLSVNNSQFQTVALPSNLKPVEAGYNDGIRTLTQLNFIVRNQTGSTVSKWQTNYGVAIKQLNAFEKKFWGIQLTPTEQNLLDRYSKYGPYRPLSIARQLELVFDGQEETKSPPLTAVQNATTNVTPVTNIGPSNQDQMLVITSIASAATVGNEVLITIDRDNDAGYVQLLADNMSLDNPLPCWIPAVNNVNISLSANTAENNIPIIITYKQFKMNTVIKSLIGKTANLTPAEQSIVEQIEAGVVA